MNTAGGDLQTLPRPAVAPVTTARLAGTSVAELTSRFPPRQTVVSWPATEDGRSAVLGRVLTSPFAVENAGSQQPRRLSVLTVVKWLQGQRGDTWQDRWRSSGAENLPDWRDSTVADPANAGPTGRKSWSRLSSGLQVLICADVIRPGLGWLVNTPQARRNLAVEMARTRDPAVFAELDRMCAAGALGAQVGQQALVRIAMIMAAKGGTVGDVRVGDCLELLTLAVESGSRDMHARSPLFYQLLHARGGWSEAAPAAIQVFSARGKPGCEQLIDRYGIQCGPMRDVLVDYLRERQPSVDFSSLQRDAYLLGKLFWADLEAHHPGIDSMKLPRDVAAAWKQRVMTKTRTTPAVDGGPPTRVVSARLDGRSVMTAVRAFYLDIAEWADDDPARWAPWAVRCPVSATDVSHRKDRYQRKSRMDQRTRDRLPVLPALTAWVDRERATTAAVLHAARNTTPGELFTAGGLTLRRSVMKTVTTGRIWVEHPDSGKRLDANSEEHRGFWTWAMVEVLRHTGIRIEELTELSHHSLIQYRLPATGELIPLLQITPSKTDQERLLVISPELADVLSTIIGRIRGDDQPDVPLVVSYDQKERVYNPPMPLLFQFRRRLEGRAVSERSLRGYLDHALLGTGITDRSGNPLRYTFHDFRRLFITDAIMHGMPPHIAQLVAGHRDINTTMGYKAVYPEEVINGHRAFIARRRAQRPGEEYRTPSDEEWTEFLGHFERRKVAVGDCGRSYATPCIHEHSCLRCPLLRPDPAERGRLTQIRDNLLDRITEAETNRWFGEAEGLKVSLAGAEDKLAQMGQITARRDSAVNLGIPTFTEAAGRATNPPRHGQNP
jgi:site-specific recombinase XerD